MKRGKIESTTNSNGTTGWVTPDGANPKDINYFEPRFEAFNNSPKKGDKVEFDVTDEGYPNELAVNVRIYTP